MGSPLTLEALEVIDAINRKGSFAAAAAALYRVPSAITYTVQKLEQDLGVKLFAKEGRRSILTPAGQTLLLQGRALLEAAERLVETTRQVDSGWESCLNIAIDSVFDFSIIYPHIEAFYQLKPDIEINLYEEVLGGTWDALIQNRADLVIGAPEAPSNSLGLQYRQISQIDWLFAVASEHPLTQLARPLSDADIQQYRAVVVRDSSQQLPPLTRRVFDRQAVLRVSSMQQKISAQRRGLGVGFLPEALIENDLSAGKLVALPLAKPATDTPLHLAWKNSSKGKALHWFIQQLQHHCQATQ